MSELKASEHPILFNGAMVRSILAGEKTQTRRVMRIQPKWIDSPYTGGHWMFSFSAGSYPFDAEGQANIATNGAGWGPHCGCPYGVTGDRLWVREKWQAIHVSTDLETGVGDDVWHAKKIPTSNENGHWGVAYAATDPDANVHKDDRGFPWRPGIHMPRWASRISLEVTNVRVQRLQDMSEEDARAEGCNGTIPAPKGFDLEDDDWNGATSYRYVHQWGMPGTPMHDFRVTWDTLNPKNTWESNPWVWAISFKRVVL